MRRLAPLRFGLVLACISMAVASRVHGDDLVPERLAPLFHAEGEQLIRRAFVPSAEHKVGEVRLLRRGAADVVQTLLYTKILRRVVGEIGNKELANWPEGAEGHGDALQYVAALARAQEDIWARLPKFERGADPRQHLMIEFALSTSSGAILLTEYDAGEDGAGLHVNARRPLVLLEPSRIYLLRNMRFILADSFKLSEQELAGLTESMPLFRVPLSTTPGAAPEK